MANQTDNNGGPFIFSDPLNSEGAPDGNFPVAQADVGAMQSMLHDVERNFRLLHQEDAWHKNLNADKVDDKHAVYLTTAVNSAEATYDPTVVDDADVAHPNLKDTTPATPAGGVNVKWQESSSNVSAYVPLSGLATVTAASTDKVYLRDTSDSDNPKAALVSDIVALAAPLDPQYVTLATNATLTNERVLTAGTGLDLVDAGAGSTITIDVDLGEMSTAAAAAADHVIFVDADDSVTKKTTMPNLLVALGAGSGDVVGPASATDNALARFDSTTGKLIQDGEVILDDAGAGSVVMHSKNNGAGASKTLILDTGTASTTAGTVDVGTLTAEGVNIGRTGKTTTISGPAVGASSIKSTSATGGIGYATGAGGAVTQLTSKSTSVTLNTPCGRITMNNAALAAGASVTFYVDCSVFEETADAVIAMPGGAGKYSVQPSLSTGIDARFYLTVTNITTGSLSEALVINFAIIKGVTS